MQHIKIIKIKFMKLKFYIGVGSSFHRLSLECCLLCFLCSLLIIFFALTNHSQQSPTTCHLIIIRMPSKRNHKPSGANHSSNTGSLETYFFAIFCTIGNQSVISRLMFSDWSPTHWHSLHFKAYNWRLVGDWLTTGQ